MSRIDYSQFGNLAITRESDVLTVTMLKRCNEAHTELSRVFSVLRADPARVIVLTGQGDSFLGQSNLDEYVQVDEAIWLRLINEARWIMNDILDLPQPLVVAMNGDAVGFGASLMSFADIVVAAEGTSISENHVTMGLVAGDGGAMTLPFMLGWNRAKRFFLLNEKIEVAELAQLGVVARVVPRDQLSVATAEITSRLVEMPPQALQWTKRTLNKMLRHSLLLSSDSALAYEGWSRHLEPARTNVERIKADLAQ